MSYRHCVTLEVFRQGMPSRAQSDSSCAIMVRRGATRRHMVPDVDDRDEMTEITEMTDDR